MLDRDEVLGDKFSDDRLQSSLGVKEKDGRVHLGGDGAVHPQSGLVGCEVRPPVWETSALDLQAERALCLKPASPYAVVGFGKGTSNRNSAVVGQLGRWTVALVQGKVMYPLPVKGSLQWMSALTRSGRHAVASSGAKREGQSGGTESCPKALPALAAAKVACTSVMVVM